jgi:diaminopimelate epimerase
VLPFIKMHGLGNDYVYIDGVTHARALRGADLPALARAISDRHTGVGGDGLIVVGRPSSARAHVRMRIFNADGSEAEMCGNGVRCVAKLAHDHLGLRHQPLHVQTGRGVLEIAGTIADGALTSATVDMGAPILELDQVPVASSAVHPAGHPYESVLHLPGANPVATFVSMGNPHAVIFTTALTRGAKAGNKPSNRARVAPGAGVPARLADIALHNLGPALEQHPAFPNRANIHFVEVHAPNHASMRTWERGSGATQACGTGACAVLVAGVLTGRLDRRADIDLPGGRLHIHWDQASDHVLMTGPATEAFTGVWPLPVARTKKLAGARRRAGARA